MRRRKVLWWSLGLLGAAILVVAIVAWQLASSLLAPANRIVGPPPADLPVETATLDSKSGSRLATWYIPADNSAATVVLLHSIRSSRLSMLSRARMLHRYGYAVVLLDLQAHGESPGEHITVGYLERHDVAAAVSFAKAKNPSHPIGVIGRSLGGAAALLGSPLGVDAMVLESVYPTIDEAVQDRVAVRLGAASPIVSPLLLWQLGPRLGISSSDLRPIDKVAAVNCPLLIIAGDQDLLTTVEETRRLFAAAAEPKQLEVFEGAAHVDLFTVDAERYETLIVDFLERNLGKSTAR